MIFDRLFHRKPEPAPLRYVVANRSESRKAITARIHTELQLRIATNRLTDDERKAAVRLGSIRPSRP